ncbi:hypothetical protein [Nocardia sp. NPDC056100]|uniref:hypothetical protein n=1 Tax=Nocardia sp. NPDC056100 TaxID=3345712 RepID=UPI0035D57BE3
MTNSRTWFGPAGFIAAVAICAIGLFSYRHYRDAMTDHAIWSLAYLLICAGLLFFPGRCRQIGLGALVGGLPVLMVIGSYATILLVLIIGPFALVVAAIWWAVRRRSTV